MKLGSREACAAGLLAVCVGLVWAGLDVEASVERGWALYRQGRFAEAEAAFARALAVEPSSLDARTGRAYALLQRDGPVAAAPVFRDVLAAAPHHEDALRGLVIAAQREGAPVSLRREGLDAARALAARAPHDAEVAAWRARLEALAGGWTERRLRAHPDVVARPDVPARALRDYLEIRRADGGYEPLFVKGFNLGAALPGKFPSEFPEDDGTYAGWLRAMADLGANSVRLYTLLPPAFYRALAAHNADPGNRRVWLVQGVWTELPPRHDFSDPVYEAELQAEIARVIDAVHGDLELLPRPGHASGLYDTDASASLLALVVGREWEPFAVEDYLRLRPDERSFDGTWLRVRDGNAMECWVARQCDAAAGYEARRHGVVHPVTFANWPTLDPLHHPTESTRREEDAWRERDGRATVQALREAPWEDDAVSVDARRIEPTAAMEAGFFASYHVYPNFPDFLNLDPRWAEGPTRYQSYLAALKRHHGTQPVLVAEFGISTSRGIAHLQPEGWHHGGHDERQQGLLVARMLHAIRDVGCAGGIVFEFMDEWFKGTWSAAPLEIPAERRRLWWNAESPEQAYGVMAARPASVRVRLDGEIDDWRDVPAVVADAQPPRRGGWADLRAVRLQADEGFLHVLLETAGGPEPPHGRGIVHRLAIDTYDPRRGETTLPRPGAARVATGVEFLVTLGGPVGSHVRVSAPYEPYARLGSAEIVSPAEPGGRFAPLLFESNRERFARAGRRFPALIVDRGVLRLGSIDADTRADVAVGAGVIEVRLPWALLNITDPSSRRVLHHTGVLDGGELGTVPTEGVRLYAFAVDARRPGAPPLDRLPREGEAAPLWGWPTWESPRFALEPKAGVPAIRAAMQDIPDVPREAP